MATIWLETPDAVNNATGDASVALWQTLTGSVTYTTAVTNNGKGSWKANTTATPARASLTTPAGILADAGSRISVYFNFANMPGGNRNLIVVLTSAASTLYGLQLTSTGILSLSGSGGNKDGSRTLSTGQWYRISVCHVITNTTNFTIKVYVNGALEITATQADFSLYTTSSSEFSIGWANTTQTANNVLYFQNICIDNGSDLTDPGVGRTDLGTLLTTAKRPFANGTANAWTTQIGTGNSGYGSGHADEVNERPLNNANGWSTTGTSSEVEEYSIEARSAGDVDLTSATLWDYMGWVRAKASASLTANMILKNSASNIALTTTETTYTKIAGSTVYPAGSTDIGVNAGTAAGTKSLYECGIIFCYDIFRPVLARSRTGAAACARNVTGY